VFFGSCLDELGDLVRSLRLVGPQNFKRVTTVNLGEQPAPVRVVSVNPGLRVLVHLERKNLVTAFKLGITANA
jgi:hypothetical protein